jgi:hypothetical protein
MENKPGFMTTEFWTMAVKVLVGIGMVTGVIRPEAQDDLINAVVMIVGAVISVVPYVTYLIARTYLKGKNPTSLPSK